MFTYRGMLGNDSKGYKSTAIPLAKKGEWQGKWHTVEITWHASDNGSFKFVFNGKTIIDCMMMQCPTRSTSSFTRMIGHMTADDAIVAVWCLPHLIPDKLILRRM